MWTIAIFLVFLLVISLSSSSGCLLCLGRAKSKSLGLRGHFSAFTQPKPLNILTLRTIKQHRTMMRREKENEAQNDSYFDPLLYDDELDDLEEPKEPDEEEGLQKFMLDSIRWYKTQLSPLMQPNCRFLPTCSSYGLESIKKFGPVKGGILTIWRILRCTPFGGCGYDAPQWPPPGYRAGSNTKPWF